MHTRVTEPGVRERVEEAERRLRARAGLDAAPDHFTRPAVRPFTADQRGRVTILFGGLTPAHETLIQAVFQSCGHLSEPLPQPDLVSWLVGRQYGNNGVCNPAYFTVGTLVRYLQGLEAGGLPRREIMPACLSRCFTTTATASNWERAPSLGKGLTSPWRASASWCTNAWRRLSSFNAEGVSARVLNLSCLKPLDWELVVDSAKRTGAMVSAEEHQVTGGLGSAVSEVLSEFNPIPLKRVGLRDAFGLSGKPEALLKHFGLLPDDIRQSAMAVIQRKKRR